MANKLPHERLRDWADRGDAPSNYPSYFMIKDMFPGITHPDKYTERDAFRKLADEVEDAIESARVEGTYEYFDMIAAEQGWPKRKADEVVEDYVKRCFLLRPMFEDDEPAQPGDVFESPIGIQERIDYFSVFDWGYRIECGKDGRAWLDLMRGDRLKRPAPKVLDADGVPIEVGDTVWLIRLPDSIKEHIGERLTVEAVTYGCVRVRTESGSVLFPRNHQLTHREPDSIRKLRDDMTMYRADMTEEGSILDVELGEWTDRLTAIMERGAE